MKRIRTFTEEKKQTLERKHALKKHTRIHKQTPFIGTQRHSHIQTYIIHNDNYKQMFTIALDEDDFETDVLTVTLLHTISGLEIC